MDLAVELPGNMSASRGGDVSAAAAAENTSAAALCSVNIRAGEPGVYRGLLHFSAVRAPVVAAERIVALVVI